MDNLPPNHHGDDNAKYDGVMGYKAALKMAVGRGGDGELVTKMAQVKPTDQVLDIGCGPGTAARIAAATGAGVTAIDPAIAMLNVGRLISRVRPTAGSISWIEGSCESIPAPDDSFSVCWTLASAHHWPDLDAGLAEVARVTKPGGIFIALEKRSPVDAVGLATHGWTPSQAQRFADILPAFGFSSATVENHQYGDRETVTVRAVAG